MQTDKRFLPPGPDGFPGSARLMIRFLGLVEAAPGSTVADIRYSGKAISNIEAMTKWLYEKKCFDIQVEVRIGSTKDRLHLNARGKKYLTQARQIHLDYESDRLERQGILVRGQKTATPRVNEPPATKGRKAVKEGV